MVAALFSKKNLTYGLKIVQKYIYAILTATVYMHYLCFHFF